MAGNGTIAYVAVIPNCDIDQKHGKAFADAKLRSGPWGYVCLGCFIAQGCSLGLGRGQELVVQKEDTRTAKDKRDAKD